MVSAIMTVLIFTTLIFFAVRYRKRKGVKPEQIEGSKILEITWSTIPFAIFLSFFVWGAVIYFQERTPPQDATEVYTVAKQWMWKFEHAGGQREINELHVPVGRDVKMIMTSQDVIHSFYVPAFRIKQDVLPGRYTTAWFHATKPGTYHLFCAEYCGTEHSGMIGWVVVMDPRDYQAWLTTGGGNQPMTDTGAKLFSDLGCVMCHRADTPGRGPSLAGIYNRPVRTRRRPHRNRRRKLHSRIDHGAERKSSEGLPSHHAHAARSNQRRPTERAGGLREIAGSTGNELAANDPVASAGERRADRSVT